MTELYLLDTPPGNPHPALSDAIRMTGWYRNRLSCEISASSILEAFDRDGSAYIGADDDSAVVQTLARQLSEAGFLVAEDQPTADVLALAPSLPSDPHVPHVVAALLNFTTGNALAAAQFAAVMVRATGERQFWTDVQTEIRTLFPWIIDMMAENNIPYEPDPSEAS